MGDYCTACLHGSHRHTDDGCRLPNCRCARHTPPERALHCDGQTNLLGDS